MVVSVENVVGWRWRNSNFSLEPSFGPVATTKHFMGSEWFLPTPTSNALSICHYWQHPMAHEVVH